MPKTCSVDCEIAVGLSRGLPNNQQKIKNIGRRRAPCIGWLLEGNLCNTYVRLRLGLVILKTLSSFKR